MFVPTAGTAGGAQHALALLYENRFELVLGVLLSMPIAKAISAKFEGKLVYRVARDALCCLLFVLCTARVVSSTFNPFIYFRF